MTRQALVSILILAGGIALPGCMLEPANEDSLCADDLPITFSGQVIATGTEVTVEAAPSSSGPFSLVTEVFAGQRSTITGMSPWRTGAEIGAWNTLTGGGKETYVRARIGSESFPFYLTTYDSEEIAGQSGLDCIIEQVLQFVSPLAAGIACRSPQSPIVRLTAPAEPSCSCPTSHTGDIAITDVETAHLYRCLVQLNGSLSVPKGYPDTVALPVLENVTGDVLLDYTPEGYDEPARDIQLPALLSVGGDLELLFDTYNYFDTNFNVGMNALTSVGGEIRVISNVAFPNFSGLAGITDHAGDVSLFAVTDGIGSQFLASLATVGGDVDIEFGQAFESPLPGLQTIGGDLSIITWRDFFAAGLPLLTSVAGNVLLQDVRDPSSLFAASIAIGGGFEIVGLSAPDLGFYASTALDAGSLLLDTTSMTVFAGPHVQIQGVGPIDIIDNDCLDSGEIAAFLADQQAGGWTGIATQSGNGGGVSCPN